MEQATQKTEQATQKTSWKQKAIREFVAYWVNVLYLSIVFGLFAWYRRLILAGYKIEYLNYGVAIMEALVLAKVIMIAEVLGLSRDLFKGKPLVYPTVYKSVVFSLFVALFTVAEGTVRGFLKGAGLRGWLMEIQGKGKYEFLAHCLMVFFMFIPFFAFRELEKILGKGKIGRLFFRDRSLPA
jgi:hypothetical protein